MNRSSFFMQAVKTKKVIGILLILLFLFIVKDIPLTELHAIPNKINFNNIEMEALQETNLFGKYIQIEMAEKNSSQKLNFNLFGFIPIRSVEARQVEDVLYAGGQTVGFSLSSEGMIVIGSNSVLTKEGKVDTLKESDIEVGDIIKEIEGEKVKSVNDAERIINKKENADKVLEIKAVRKNKEVTLKLKPALDVQTNKYKMGLWVRDDAAGVGTLTFIKKDDYRFGALGHPICDIDTKVPFSVDKGKVYKSAIIGIKRAREGVPGELKGLFIKGQKEEGEVDKNSEFGVYGYINKESGLLKKESLCEIGGRLTAHAGKAKIRVALDGEHTEEYDIEIIKTNYQNISKQRSMVIRVTDKKLLEKTGGIVQGMSGSPIIQNDKIIGAVTHVFVNDPKKGFGVYLDWMINE